MPVCYRSYAIIEASMMYFDEKRNMYLGYTSEGKCIAVDPETMLEAIRGSIVCKQDFNLCLNPDNWIYTKETTGVYELEQLEDLGYTLEDALDIAECAVLEAEELVYTCEKKRKSNRIKVTVSSEQCEDYVVSYSNIATAYAGMQAQGYYHFQVFKYWYPLFK